jgi:hypothetical protein
MSDDKPDEVRPIIGLCVECRNYAIQIIHMRKNNITWKIQVCEDCVEKAVLTRAKL